MSCGRWYPEKRAGQADKQDMRLKRFGDFVSPGGKHYDGSSILLHLQAPELQLDPSDLAEQDFQPHCTLISGIEPRYRLPDVSSVMLAVRSCVTGKVILSNPSMFDGPERDVVKMDVSSDFLTTARKACLGLKHEERFDFHPHCTIAFVRKGSAGKYVSSIPKRIEAEVTFVVFSSFDGTKSYLFTQ